MCKNCMIAVCKIGSPCSNLKLKAMDTRRRLEKCWTKDISWDLYPTVINEVKIFHWYFASSYFTDTYAWFSDVQGCHQVAKAISVPPAAILGGLLILTSFVLSRSAVSVPGTDWVEPGLIWLAISMPTGSRKSTVHWCLIQLLKDMKKKVCRGMFTLLLQNAFLWRQCTLRENLTISLDDCSAGRHNKIQFYVKY